jgi:hypothetical protein
MDGGDAVCTASPRTNLIHFCSIPVVDAPFVVVAQQKAESLPHIEQTCSKCVLAPFPTPTTVMVLPQPGQRCFSPGVIFVTWPLDSLVGDELDTNGFAFGADHRDGIAQLELIHLRLVRDLVEHHQKFKDRPINLPSLPS